MGAVHPIDAESRRRRRSALVVGLVLLLGALGTGLATVALHSSARGWAQKAFAQKHDVIGKVVLAELIQYATALADLSASLGAQTELTASAFAAITAPINNQRLPGASEISFVVPASAEQAPGVQARWRALGSAGLTLTTTPGHQEHYFAVLSRALDGGRPEIGSDFQQMFDAADALRAARTSRQVTTSPTFLPPGADDRFFLMAAAVFATAPEAESGAFRGWVTLMYRGADFLGPAVGLIGGDQVSVEFADISGGGEAVTIATWKPAARTDPTLPASSAVLPFPPDQWSLTVRPTVRLLGATETWLSRGAALIGGLITVLLAALTASVVTSRDRALRRVDEATAELRDDIERREAVEQQLRLREEELSAFAGVVAHDLRSPLTNVIGYAELLAGGDPLTDKQASHLARVQAGAGRMQNLIGDLLAYATADNSTLRITEVDLDALVDDILAERLSTDTTARISKSPLPTVPGDPSQLRQVLDNLIGNAVKYTPADRSPDITITHTEEAGHHRVEVADRGIGIPDEQRGEVFNAFTRAEGAHNYPGTGLGLAIVQRIIERHHGTVGADPNPGGGTRFWFTLPTTA